MKTLFISLFFITFFLFKPSFSHAITLTPRQRAALRFANTHGFGTPVKKQSLLSKVWSTIGPGILGSAGVAAGAAVAWYTLRKKKKTFSTYYEQIKEAQNRYNQSLQSGTANKAQVKSAFKKELTFIQEEAELNAAEKKLDQEQLTAIINKVKRMMDEIAA